MQRRGLTYGLLIVVAVLMGIIASGLPRLHRDGPLPLVAAAPSTTATTPTTAPVREPTTTVPAPHAPATVTVLVANASGVGGAATKRASALTAAGYHVLKSVNAAGAATSDVYWVAGAQADARAVAATLGLAGDAVHAMPAKPPVANTGAATVVVVIGRDRG